MSPVALEIDDSGLRPGAEQPETKAPEKAPGRAVRARSSEGLVGIKGLQTFSWGHSGAGGWALGLI